MRVLKLKLFQETVCYKKPFAMKIAETYPLPPYSTVNGLLHKLLEAESYIPFSLSIQGSYESLINNYQTTYFYKKNTVTTMPMNNHSLLMVNLIIHIAAKEEVLEALYDKITHLNEFISLGRKEDLVRIDEAEFVEVREVQLNDELEEDNDEMMHHYIIKQPIYMPTNQLEDEDIKGIRYCLCSHYLEKAELRQWETVDVLYVEKDTELTQGKILVDNSSDKDIVFFHLKV